MIKHFIFRLKSLLFLYMLGFSIISNAQESVVSKLLTYKKLLDKNPVEKIHIHTNQPLYMAYDTIWFKAYVINANINRPSVASKMLMVDLIAPDGKIIRQAKTQLNFGLANGYLILADSLNSGNYTLRAYTGSMKAFGTDAYYNRNLLIKSTTENAMKKNKDDMSIGFFPEGGDLVNGLTSIAAFKAIDVDGLGIDVKGKVLDNSGTTISSIATDYLGMGRFEFTPELGKTYYAEFVNSKGIKSKFQLPDVKKQGYGLKISQSDENIEAKVTGTPELLLKGTATLIGSQDGITRYILKINPADANTAISIPKSKFYTGIIQFTLFGTDDLPVAERLTFCNNHDLLKISSDHKTNYAKKEQVKLLLDLKNTDDNPEIGSLSVSVYNETIYPINDDDEISIYSDLLLTNDLKGYVEKPNYYFGTGDEKTRKRNLDNLMLTQGWRRFSWKDQLSKSLPIVSDDKLIDNEITGNVSLTSGKPYINGNITLFQSGLNRNIVQTKTDSAGNFTFKNLNIIDTASFVISTNTITEKKNLKIKVYGLEKNEQSSLKPLQTQRFQIDSDSLSTEYKKLDDLYFKSKGINLHRVNISAKKAGPIKESANLNGPGKAEAIVLAKDLETTHDLSTYLLNNITGLKTFEGRLYSRDVPEPGRLFPPPPAPMLVVFDGMQMDQFNFDVSDINPNDVESIEVLKGEKASLYGINGSGGALIITSKKGKDHSNDAVNKTAKGILPITVIGYQVQKEFYSPVYTVNNLSTKDFRRVIYWNSNVVTSTDKKTEVSFYNSDYPGKYKIVIEGLNADGQIGRGVYYYEVK